jgi:hypothetical protein
MARLTIRHEDLVAGLSLALKLASSDLHSLYLRASPTIRRLMNQAIFEAIWVWDEDHARAELASPFKELAVISQATRGREQDIDPKPLEDVLASVGAYEDDQAPDTWAVSEDLVVGSISEVMVELVGLEPTTFWLPARRSSN